MYNTPPSTPFPRLALLMGLTGVAIATVPIAARPAPRQSNSAPSDSVDRAVIYTLVKADRDEVAISRTALPSLMDGEVKGFAQRMIDDHGANLTAVSTTAHRLGLPVPMDRAPENNSGATTDAQYIAAQVTGHRQLLTQLPTDPALVKDAGLKTQLTDTRRTVQMHLDDAVRIQARLSGKMP